MKNGCIFETEIGYLRYDELPYYLELSDGDMLILGKAQRGESLRIGPSIFRCVGTIKELEKANAARRDQVFRMAKRNLRLEKENERLKHNLEKLSSVLKSVLGTLELDGTEIIDTETGEVLSD